MGEMRDFSYWDRSSPIVCQDSPKTWRSRRSSRSRTSSFLIGCLFPKDTNTLIIKMQRSENFINQNFWIFWSECKLWINLRWNSQETARQVTRWDCQLPTSQTDYILYPIHWTVYTTQYIFKVNTTPWTLLNIRWTTCHFGNSRYENLCRSDTSV